MLYGKVQIISKSSFNYFKTKTKNCIGGGGGCRIVVLGERTKGHPSGR